MSSLLKEEIRKIDGSDEFSILSLPKSYGTEIICSTQDEKSRVVKIRKRHRHYKGTIRVYDDFFTKRKMALRYCKGLLRKSPRTKSETEIIIRRIEGLSERDFTVATQLDDCIRDIERLTLKWR